MFWQFIFYEINTAPGHEIQKLKFGMILFFSFYDIIILFFIFNPEPVFIFLQSFVQNFYLLIIKRKSERLYAVILCFSLTIFCPRFNFRNYFYQSNIIPTKKNLLQEVLLEQDAQTCSSTSYYH